MFDFYPLTGDEDEEEEAGARDDDQEEYKAVVDLITDDEDDDTDNDDESRKRASGGTFKKYQVRYSQSTNEPWPEFFICFKLETPIVVKKFSKITSW